MLKKRAAEKIELHKKEVRYLISGGASFIGEYAVFLLAITVLPLIFSNVISFSVGLLTSFLLHKLWTFADDEYHHNTHVQFVTYALLAVVNIFLTSILLYVVVEFAGMESWIAKLLSMLAMVTWNYFILNLHIFKSKTE